MKKKIVIIASSIPLVFSCEGRVDHSAVNTLDIDRYMGRWYEIVRTDNRFERGMAGVTADYTLLNDGKIEAQLRLP